VCASLSESAYWGLFKLAQQRLTVTADTVALQALEAQDAAIEHILALVDSRSAGAGDAAADPTAARPPVNPS